MNKINTDTSTEDYKIFITLDCCGFQIYGNIDASNDRSDYDELDRHWLLFDGVNDLVVNGGGTINGNGDVWWKNSCKINKSLVCSHSVLFFDLCFLTSVVSLSLYVV